MSSNYSQIVLSLMLLDWWMSHDFNVIHSNGHEDILNSKRDFNKVLRSFLDRGLNPGLFAHHGVVPVSPSIRKYVKNISFNFFSYLWFSILVKIH